MARERKESPAFNYNYEQLLAFAKRKGQLPDEKSNYIVHTNRGFNFLTRKDCDYIKKKEMDADIKLHVNIGGDTAEIIKAWNALAPLLTAKDSIIQQVKVVVPFKAVKIFQENIDILKKFLARIKLTSAASPIKELEKKSHINDTIQAIELLQAESERRVKCTQITIYIFKKSKHEGLDIESYKKLIRKINTKLTEEKIAATSTPVSDFKISDYISLRGIYDKNKDPVDIYKIAMPEIWNYFKTLAQVKALVPAEFLVTAAPPIFIAEPASLRVRDNPNPNVEKMGQVILFLKKILVDEYIADFWKDEAKGNTTYLRAIEDFRIILQFKNMEIKGMFWRIAAISETLIATHPATKSAPGLFAEEDWIYQLFNVLANYKKNQEDLLLNRLAKVFNPEDVLEVKPSKKETTPIQSTAVKSTKP